MKVPCKVFFFFSSKVDGMLAEAMASAALATAAASYSNKSIEVFGDP